MYGLFPLQKDCTKFFSVPQISIYVEFFTMFLAWDLCSWVIEHCGKSDNKVIFFFYIYLLIAIYLRSSCIEEKHWSFILN